MRNESLSLWRVLLTALLAACTAAGCGVVQEEQAAQVAVTKREALQLQRARGHAWVARQGVLGTSQPHSVALAADGTVWAWGSSGGYVGDGSTVERPTPVRVPGLTDAVFVSSTSTDNAFQEHTLVVRSDGSVWSWGGNIFGQLGDGTQVHRAAPVRVPGLTEVQSVSAGASYSLAVRADGTVWGWGFGLSGQLGDGTTAFRRFTPVRVVGLEGAVAVSAGLDHSLALREDGTVWAWGGNSFGQLGDGTAVRRLTAVQVQGLTEVVAVAAGGYFSAALRADGTVWTWGSNVRGQLGDGTAQARPLPAPVEGLTDVVALSAGGRHLLALRADRTVWAWGGNDGGQLGNGRLSFTEFQPRPMPIAGVNEVVAVAAGCAQSLLLRVDGTLWALGVNQEGRLGTGSDARFSPARVAGLSGARSVGAGMSHSLEVGPDGRVWRWGDDTFSFVESESPPFLFAPEPLEGLTGVASVVAGAMHSLALREDGTVWAWGANGSGELGDGTNTSRTTPAPVVGLADVKALAAGPNYVGGSHSLALRRDGTVWAWGSNDKGQLGDGTRQAHNTPVRVLEGVVAIAANGKQSLAVRADGTVLSWGSDGASGARPTPSPVPGLTDVVAVAIGDQSFAVRADGTVWSWPSALYRVPAGGTVDPALLPAPVPGVTGAVAVSAGGFHTLVLRADGTVLSWGTNLSGALGRETDALDDPLPAPVPGLRDVVSLSAGGIHALAVRADGSVWSWGRNDHGQLGLGISPVHVTPARVLLPCRFTGLPSAEERNAGSHRCEG